MIFQYWCEDCNGIVEESYPIGKAKKEVACPQCGKTCERYYGEMTFILGGPAGQWPSKRMKFNKEMTDKNTAAGERMRSERTGTAPKLIDQR